MQNENEGIEQAVDHADQVSPGWSDRAFEMVKRYPNVLPFFVQDLREWAHDNGLEDPPSNRAWGGVIKRANHAGLVKFVEYKPKPHEGQHNQPAAVWQKI